MTRNAEASLRESLDAIDGIRMRIFSGGWLAVAATLAAYWYLAYVQRTQSVERQLSAAVLALTCLIAWATFSISLVVLRMTKRIVRAIEVATRQSP